MRSVPALKHHTSKVMFAIHACFFCIYVNLAVRDALPFGVRVNMDDLEIHRFQILFVFCLLQVINFHDFRVAILLGAIAFASELAVMSAPAIQSSQKASETSAYRFFHLATTLCIGQYV